MANKTIIDNLRISPVVIEGLKMAYGVKTVDDLAKLTRRQVAALYSVGPSKIVQIEMALKKFGLKLATEEKV